MSKSARLRLHDLRAIYHLVGECRDLGDDPVGWRRHLFAELGRMTRAALVAGGEVARRGPELRPVGTVDLGWENGFDRAALIAGLSGVGANLLINPQFVAYFRQFPVPGGAGLTRQDLVPDRDWHRSWYFGAIHEPIGIGHVLVSFVPIGGAPGEYSGVTLSRAAGNRRDFGLRDRALVREAHAVIAPLVGRALARHTEPSPAALPPRVRQVLRCLLEGDGDKQVAKRLGISGYTVNQYVKVIFAHFGVQSRTELLARWVRRGWGSGFAWADPDAG
jgi:DNA-binding CsgD family transcriptional regulator